MKLLGEYGLRCKREIWRAQLALAKVRSAARKLLTLDEKDPKRLFEGDALLRRLARYGVLTQDEKRLDDVLRLSVQRFLERRLQTKVFKTLAKSVHHARTLIFQRHIRVGKQLVNQANFMVRTDSESHIDFALSSPYNKTSGKPVSFRRRGRGRRGRHQSQPTHHWPAHSPHPVPFAATAPFHCRAALRARRQSPPVAAPSKCCSSGSSNSDLEVWRREDGQPHAP